MARFQQIAEHLRALTSLDARSKILAKGLARGFIWTNGELPEGVTIDYGRHLTGNLLDYGYSILVKALRLYENNIELETACHALRYAAECIEAAVRRGKQDNHRGFNLLISASAFHLAGYAARSFCLLEEERDALNLCSIEKILMRLLRKELKDLRYECYNWLNNTNNTDEGLSASIDAMDISEPTYEFDTILVKALSRQYITAIALFEYALYTGKEAYLEQAKAKIKDGMGISKDTCHVSQWWIHKLTLLLMDDIWDNSLYKLLPKFPEQSPDFISSTIGFDISETSEMKNWDSLREKFIALQCSRNISEVSLWPSQKEAAKRVWDISDDLVVALPTSAGKTKIAELCILRCLASGKRAIYITPLRALSAQIEQRLSRAFSPLGFSISSLYGASGVTFEDINTLKEDNIVVSTPEKLDFALRQDSSLLDDIGVIVLDEGHMIGLGTREIRYEVLVQRLLQRSDSNNRRIVCLSAIFSSGDSFDDFTAWLRSDASGSSLHSDWRPTRQRRAALPWKGQYPGRLIFVQDSDFDKAFIPDFLRPSSATTGTRQKVCPDNSQELTLKATEKLVLSGHKVLVYCPQKRSVEPLGEMALKLHSQGLFETLINESRYLEKAIAIGNEWLGSNHIALKCLRLGIGIHHGSLPRPFLSEIEHLLDRKILPIVIASPTMAQGVDLTCSALVFHSIYQFGDQLIKSSDYSNVIGRVGRAFVDLDGLIVFPVFELTKRKLDALKQLWRNSTRSLESGILKLIEAIIGLIKQKLNLQDDAFEEYILNQHFDWDLSINNESDEDEYQSEAYFLDSLDNAILATIENLDCDANELAAILDAALQSSLWKRRLTRLPETTANEQKAVFLSRASWLWHRTSFNQRKGLFSGGIGFEAGKLIEVNLDSLKSALLTTDRNLAENDIESFYLNIESIASILFAIYPYSRKERPDDWKTVLKLWLTGASLDPLAGNTKLLSCIQEDFVFRLVWGVEAIRAYSREIGDTSLESLSGDIPLCITYGVPSRSAALLLQLGLPSRQIAQTLLEQFPANLNTKLDIPPWIQQIPNIFEPESSNAIIWSDFSTKIFKVTNASPTMRRIRFRNMANSPDISFISEDHKTILTTPDLRVLREYELDSNGLTVIDVSIEGNDLLIRAIQR